MTSAHSTILVVEDDLDVQEALALLLREQGFDVVTASNGQEGLERLRERPDTRIILLDLMMPVMDGATFRQHQLDDRALARIPFILLTARTNCEQVATALGAVACFRKPFQPELLLELLRGYR